MPQETTTLLAEVQNCMAAHHLLPAGAHVMTAVSGGPDSMALLALLVQLRPVYHHTLSVAHVHHQLRGHESDRDAAFVAAQAARLRLPFYETRVDVKAWQHHMGLSPQHAARELRYQALYALQQSIAATHIALGHTANDQAETLLLRLLRGSGPEGLAGMPVVRGALIRPLLTSQRHTILAYLQAAGIAWIEDSSNAHRVYLRNQVRLDLLPVLEAYNPRLLERLNDLADMLQAENALLRAHTETWLPRTFHWQTAQQVVIQCDALASAPVAIQRRLLRYALDRLAGSAPSGSFRHLEGLRQFVLSAPKGQRLTLPGRLVAERQRETVWLWNMHTLPARDLVLALPVPGEVAIPGLGLHCHAERITWHPDFPQHDAQQAFVDLDRTGDTLTVRFPQPGDRFYPLGAPGSKKLQDFFVNARVPRLARAYTPLVVRDQEVVWVVGYRIAEPFRIRSETQRLLHLRCTPTA
jgi:tRNA(Ile)-lysidine synthase